MEALARSVPLNATPVKWGNMATGFPSVAVVVSKLFPTLHSVQDQEQLPTHAQSMDETFISKYKRQRGQRKEKEQPQQQQDEDCMIPERRITHR